MSQEIAVVENGGQVAGRDSGAMTLKGIIDRVNIVHEVMRKVMRENTHYGTVPGCGKKQVLLKPGADLLAMTFRLSPEYRIERHDLDNGHREYEVTCVMRGPDGTVVGEGVGSASSMERKYRYRYGEDGAKIENEDIADVFNTVLKMAKKRAHVDATLTCTGASDMFTQDLIDEDAAPVKASSTRQPIKPPVATGTDAELQHVTGPIADVKIAEGEKHGKPWKKYGVRIGELTLGTFDTKLGDKAAELHSMGVTVDAVYEPNGRYTTLKSIAQVAKVADAPAAHAADKADDPVGELL
jgi:hypothetical protein